MLRVTSMSVRPSSKAALMTLRMAFKPCAARLTIKSASVRPASRMPATT